MKENEELKMSLKNILWHFENKRYFEAIKELEKVGKKIINKLNNREKKQ